MVHSTTHDKAAELSPQIGDFVKSIKNNNAFGNYFVGEVVAIHKVPHEQSRHYFAEKNIAIHQIVHVLSLGFTKGRIWKPVYLYDIRYDDGSIDERVSIDKIRPQL